MPCPFSGAAKNLRPWQPPPAGGVRTNYASPTRSAKISRHDEEGRFAPKGGGRARVAANRKPKAQTMADIPRDPNELAREILSGRITIEQLAREQARRRAPQAAGAAPSPRAPAVPAQRSIPPRPGAFAPGSRPIRVVPQPTAPVRPPAEFTATRRVIPERTVAGSASPGRTVRATATIFPQQPARRRLSRSVSEGAAVAPRAATSKTTAPGPSAAPSAVAAAPQTLRQVLGKVLTSRSGLRSVVILSEIIQPPLALRQASEFPR